MLLLTGLCLRLLATDLQASQQRRLRLRLETRCRPAASAGARLARPRAATARRRCRRSGSRVMHLPVRQSWCDILALQSPAVSASHSLAHILSLAVIPLRCHLQEGLERAAAADGRDTVSSCALRAASQWLQRMEARRFTGRAREARLCRFETALNSVCASFVRSGFGT